MQNSAGKTMKYLRLILMMMAFAIVAQGKAQSTDAPAPAPQARAVHPAIGTSARSDKCLLLISLEAKKQNYSASETETRDPDIVSPKSVNIHPNGEKYYVNSLEGAKTVVYEAGTNKKLKVIQHVFNESDSSLWSPPSGLFLFTHYTKRPNPNTFTGKPVESAFSHEGRYLWVPYYRRSFDINAQDPSAVAVIDTEADSIIKLMETGPLPKMIAVSHDNKYVAITHWGDNTVGIIDISGDTPDDWHYLDYVVVQRKLQLNFRMDTVVNRDVNSGLCLRGTAFTPDDRYLLVGCMGGGGGIAVIDMTDLSYQGMVYGMKSNLRHLLIRDGYIYLSINRDGYIQRTTMESFFEAVDQMEEGKTYCREWDNCKVGAGARTIEITPDGRYIIAACNFSSCLYIVDAERMEAVATIPADSYPVGLDISKDGNFIYTTSQGRNGIGGNCVDIYKLKYKTF